MAKYSEEAAVQSKLNEMLEKGQRHAVLMMLTMLLTLLMTTMMMFSTKTVKVIFDKKLNFSHAMILMMMMMIMIMIMRRRIIILI